MDENNISINDRIYVGQLLKAVRLGDLCVREAMIRYPRDTKDDSLLAAYHALIHYEADEDLRLRDPLYKEEQDDYLEFIYQTLEKGESLPVNIINNYKDFYETAPILHEQNIKGFWKSFWKFLNIKEDN